MTPDDQNWPKTTQKSKVLLKTTKAKNNSVTENDLEWLVMMYNDLEWLKIT